MNVYIFENGDYFEFGKNFKFDDPPPLQFQKTAKVGGVGKIQNFKFGEWGYETKIKNSQN